MVASETDRAEITMSTVIIKHTITMTPNLTEGETKISLSSHFFLKKITWNYYYIDVGHKGSKQLPLKPISINLLDNSLNPIYRASGLYSFTHSLDRYLPLDKEIIVMLENPNFENKHQLKVEISLDGVFVSSSLNLKEDSEVFMNEMDVVINKDKLAEPSDKETWLAEKTIPAYEEESCEEEEFSPREVAFLLQLPGDPKSNDDWNNYVKRQQLSRKSKYQTTNEPYQPPFSKVSMFLVFALSGLVVSPVIFELVVFVLLLAV